MASSLSNIFERNMRALVLVGFALVASASALVDVNVGYHEAVGIPTAEKIRLAEEEMMSAKEERVVGGALAPTNSHPYFAGLLISLLGVTGNSVCGSTLLSQNRLVTAAHCWTDGRNQATQFLVILGSKLLFFGGTRIPTSNVIMHPQYLPANLNNDIAMIYLPYNIFFTGSIQPISLPNSSELWDSFVGNWAVAAGFGRTSDAQAGASTEVSHVTLQVISVAQCQAVFGNNFVVQSTICTNGAGGVGICGGDSGGPLVLNRGGRTVLIGVSSFVAGAGCQLGFPSAFARVTSFNNFIHQHM
ncbi:collagenase-like [Trichoplusia ni]|uniref:Collagenase-like n=1 Tax=Trichoplusia ni TaxID=7111 RepID=A0A7E5VPX9_TRINI|nr:collagenase-like [Trichoplusia ni]